jgi:hypothetical protein
MPPKTEVEAAHASREIVSPVGDYPRTRPCRKRPTAPRGDSPALA